jgi:hypothetical protein
LARDWKYWQIYLGQVISQFYFLALSVPDELYSQVWILIIIITMADLSVLENFSGIYSVGWHGEEVGYPNNR